MSVVGEAIYRVFADTSDFMAGLDTAQKRSEAMVKQMEATGDKLSKFVTLPLMGIATAAIAASKGAEDSAVKFNAIFKGLATQATQWAEVYSRAVGREADDTMGLLSSMQQTAQAIGLTRGAALDFSQAAVTLSGDLAAFNGTDAAAAFDAVRAAAAGSYKGMRDYGVIIDTAAVQNEALALGLIRTKDEMTSATAAQAAFSLITKQTADAQGAASRQTDTLSFKLQALKTAFSEAAQSIGNVLMPFFKQAVTVVTNLANAFTSMDPAAQKAVVTFAAIVAAVGPILLIVPKVIAAAKAMSMAFSLGLGPIGLIAAAIAGIAAATVYLVSKNQELRREQENLKKAIDGTATTTTQYDDALKTLNKTIADLGGPMTSKEVDAFNRQKTAVTHMANALKYATDWADGHTRSMSAQTAAYVEHQLVLNGVDEKTAKAIVQQKEWATVQWSLQQGVYALNFGLGDQERKLQGLQAAYDDYGTVVGNQNDLLAKEAAERQKLLDKENAVIAAQQAKAKTDALVEQALQAARDKVKQDAADRLTMEQQITDDLLTQSENRLAIIDNEEKKRLAAFDAVKPDPADAEAWAVYEQRRTDIAFYYANERGSYIQGEAEARATDLEQAGKDADAAQAALDKAADEKKKAADRADADEVKARRAAALAITTDLMKQNGDRIGLIEQERDARLTALDAMVPKPDSLAAVDEWEKSRADIIKFYDKQVADEKQKLHDEETKRIEAEQQKLVEAAQTYLQSLGSVVSSIGSIFNAFAELQIQGNNDLYDGLLQKEQDTYDQQKADLKAKFDSGAIDQTQYNDQMAMLSQDLADKQKAIEDDKAAKEKEIKRGQAKTAKDFAIFQAIIGIASAVIKAAPDAALMILAGVVGAAQLAAIVAQPLPELAEGGIASRDQIARIGERGPEAVIPLSPAVLNSIGAGIAVGLAERQAVQAPSGGEQTIVLVLDGEILGKIVTRNIANRRITIHERDLVRT